MATFWLGLGDSIAVLKGWPDNSVDAIVCDPPYGLEFMGKDWDGADGFRRSLNENDVARANAFGRLSSRAPEYRTAGSVRTFDHNEVIGGVGSERDFKAGATGKAHSHGFENHDSIAFMIWCRAWSAECLRVLKPGGHMLAFGGTRTYHQLAMGVELAGFEIRDSIHWFYASGFPKSVDISKAIDKKLGAQRPTLRVVGTKAANLTDEGYQTRIPNAITGPATPEAQTWAGWGTALKPAHEPIIVARKPLIGRIVDNVLKHGTGGLNIDACRIPMRGGEALRAPQSDPDARTGTLSSEYFPGSAGDPARMHAAQAESIARANALGRWPTNVIVGHGETCDYVPNGKNNVYGENMGGGEWNQHADGRWPANVIVEHAEACFVSGMDETGANETWTCADGCPVTSLDAQSIDPLKGASRILYSPKVRRAERDFGCEHLPPKGAREAVERDPESAGAQNPRAGAGRTGTVRNHHPTVKPVNLMRYLVRLVTPVGGTVLDPFTGSGSTGIAALIEGFNFVGIDQSEEYLTIAHHRCTAALARGREFFGDSIFGGGSPEDADEDDTEDAGTG